MNDLVIQAPRQGIALSPHIGFSDIRNLDISSIPGVVTLNTIMVKKSAATVTNYVKWLVRDSITPTNIYALDNDGVVYNSANSGETWALLSDRGGTGQGIAIWKNYLFVVEDTTIDVYGPLDGAATWTDNWQTIDSDLLWHPLIVSINDNKLYGGVGKYVFSIDENTGQTFAPATPATYTFTAQALDLPSAYRIKCIEELGNNLMCGTWQGTNIYDIRIGNIFPWDRSSSSFGQPIIFDEYGIHALRNTGNILTVLAGISGTIYRCDGVNAYIIGQLPMDLRGGKYLEWYPGALCTYKNKIFFGIGNGGTTAIDGMGVYSLLQTGQGNILNLEHGISTENFGTTSAKVTALLPVTRDTLLAAWQSSATYGIDLSSATSYDYVTDYGGYFLTPLYVVGTNLNKRTFNQIEFQLARPLRTGEGINVEYRDDLTASFTEVGTYDFTTFSAIESKNVTLARPLTILPCEQIQLKISLLGSATTSPELRSVTLR